MIDFYLVGYVFPSEVPQFGGLLTFFVYIFMGRLGTIPSILTTFRSLHTSMWGVKLHYVDARLVLLI